MQTLPAQLTVKVVPDAKSQEVATAQNPKLTEAVQIEGRRDKSTADLGSKEQATGLLRAPAEPPQPTFDKVFEDVRTRESGTDPQKDLLTERVEPTPDADGADDPDAKTRDATDPVKAPQMQDGPPAAKAERMASAAEEQTAVSAPPDVPKKTAVRRVETYIRALQPPQDRPVTEPMPMEIDKADAAVIAQNGTHAEARIPAQPGPAERAKPQVMTAETVPAVTPAAPKTIRSTEHTSTVPRLATQEAQEEPAEKPEVPLAKTAKPVAYAAEPAPQTSKPVSQPMDMAGEKTAVSTPPRDTGRMPETRTPREMGVARDHRISQPAQATAPDARAEPSKAERFVAVPSAIRTGALPAQENSELRPPNRTEGGHSEPARQINQIAKDETKPSLLQPVTSDDVRAPIPAAAKKSGPQADVVGQAKPDQPKPPVQPLMQSAPQVPAPPITSQVPAPTPAPQERTATPLTAATQTSFAEKPKAVLPSVQAAAQPTVLQNADVRRDVSLNPPQTSEPVHLKETAQTPARSAPFVAAAVPPTNPRDLSAPSGIPDPSGQANKAQGASKAMQAQHMPYPTAQTPEAPTVAAMTSTKIPTLSPGQLPRARPATDPVRSAPTTQTMTAPQTTQKVATPAASQVQTPFMQDTAKASLLPKDSVLDLSTLSKHTTGEAPPLGRVDAATAQTSLPVSPATRPDLPAHVARQLVEAFQSTQQRPVDIALNPEELGRVRLALSASEAGMILQVTADRPETLDLMRRNIGQLGQEFQDLGYGDISFSFAGGDAQHEHTDDDAEGRRPDRTPEAEDHAMTADIPPAQPSTGETTGLDVRL